MHRWLLVVCTVVCAACGGGSPGVQIGPPRPEVKTERVELAPKPTTTGALPKYTGGCSGKNELTATMDRREIKKSDGKVNITLKVSLERPDCGSSFSEFVSVKGEAAGRTDLVSGSIRIGRFYGRTADAVIEVGTDVMQKYSAASFGKTLTSWWKLCSASKTSYELTLRIHAEVEPATDDKLLKLLVRCDA